MPKVVMAYSGGLETTACIYWLQNKKGLDVITCFADMGQAESFRSPNEISARPDNGDVDVETEPRSSLAYGSENSETLSQRALALGVDSVHIADLREKFIADFAFPALRADAHSEAGSCLSVALSRAAITQEVVNVAQDNNCEYIAHGGRGKSNDQARFVLTVAVLAPDLEVIAPLRESQLITRKSVIEYAKKHDLPIEAGERVSYNNDINLWGACVSSIEIEDLWKEVPDHLYRMTVAPSEAPDRPEEIVIGFEHGLPVSLDDKMLSPAQLVTALNKVAGRHGVGRLDAIENFTVGFKTRVVYEAPAAEVLHLAHEALEDICLSADVLRTQRMLSRRYSELVYRGDWFTALREALDQFFAASQRNVTGRVHMKLFKGNCCAVGRESSFSLYNRELATGGEHDTFDHSAAHGFLDIISISRKLEAHQRENE